MYSVVRSNSTCEYTGSPVCPDPQMCMITCTLLNRYPYSLSLSIFLKCTKNWFQNTSFLHLLCHYFDQRVSSIGKKSFSAKPNNNRWRNENEQLYFIEQMYDSRTWLCTWQTIQNGDVAVSSCQKSIGKFGYRHIDTAQGYKREWGTVLDKQLKKNGWFLEKYEIFLTTKLWNENHSLRLGPFFLWRIVEESTNRLYRSFLLDSLAKSSEIPWQLAVSKCRNMARDGRALSSWVRSKPSGKQLLASLNFPKNWKKQPLFSPNGQPLWFFLKRLWWITKRSSVLLPRAQCLIGSLQSLGTGKDLWRSWNAGTSDRRYGKNDCSNRDSLVFTTW